MASSPDINQLSDHLFRNYSGKMISILTRIFGAEHIDTVEDVVQSTFVEALNTWKFRGIPDNPPAWLFRVAKNKAIDVIRKNKFLVNYDFSDPDRILLQSEYTLSSAMNRLWDENLIKDDTLRMMYACCQPEIAKENQLVFILKMVCGLSTSEIAKAFLTSEETIAKRIYRTKEIFRAKKIKPAIPSVGEIKNRTDAVLSSIYLLFNEGYSSTNSTDLIRNDLIQEAMSLAIMITENEHTNIPEAFALMALICFHTARSGSRISKEGEIILLADQDRSSWDKKMIALGNEYMNKAASGDSLSTYHIEAAIAFEHCIAKDFKSTNWERIYELYTWLLNIAPSPITELNRSAVVLYMNGPVEALKHLEEISSKEIMEKYYLYNSLLGEIYLKTGNKNKAKEYFAKAMQLTKSEAERKLLELKSTSH